jgi:ribosomal protein S27E
MTYVRVTCQACFWTIAAPEDNWELCPDCGQDTLVYFFPSEGDDE